MLNLQSKRHEKKKKKTRVLFFLPDSSLLCVCFISQHLMLSIPLFLLRLHSVASPSSRSLFLFFTITTQRTLLHSFIATYTIIKMLRWKREKNKEMKIKHKCTTRWNLLFFLIKIYFVLRFLIMDSILMEKVAAAAVVVVV